MKVLYDARWIRTDAPSDGVTRYSSNLARELAKLADVDLTVLICDERQRKSLPDVPHLLVHEPANIIKERKIANLLNPHNFDVVYSPFFLMGAHGRNYKLVLTIHDLIYFTHKTPPQWLPQYVRVVWRLFHTSYRPLRALLNSADAIATVSDTARDELIARKVTSRPIYTVPNAAADEFSAVKASNHYKSNHIVYMGAFTPYKNVECLIDALEHLPAVTLDLCSKIPPQRLEILSKRAAEKGVGDRVAFHDGVSDAKYLELLSNARCLVTASRLEGFGLPLLEGQRAGVPVVCSDTPIFREVGQESVLYFDPDNPSEAAAQIAKLTDQKTSEKLIKLGHENVARYSWSASAKKAIEIIYKVLSR